MTTATAKTITPTSTYEEMVEYARQQSERLGQFSAVVEVVCYMSERSYRTVMSGKERIQSRQRGNSFIGVACQFCNGEPLR